MFVYLLSVTLPWGLGGLQGRIHFILSILPFSEPPRARQGQNQPIPTGFVIYHSIFLKTTSNALESPGSEKRWRIDFLFAIIGFREHVYLRGYLYSSVSISHSPIFVMSPVCLFGV
jgi:hypothetical protein